MKLRLKLIVPVVLVTAAMSALTVYLISDHIKRDALERAQNVTAEYIIAKAQEQLTAGNFQDEDFQGQRPVFESFMKLIRTPEILKIKVFNAKFDIIYSTVSDDIGKKTDSTNYRRSLQEGKIAATIKQPVDEKSNIELIGYRQLMEVYIPVPYNNRTEGVIEAYFKMDAINQAIEETSKKVIGLIVLFATAVCAIIYLLLTVLIVRPLRKLTVAAERLAAGQTDIALPLVKRHDEIGALQKALQGIADRSGGGKKLW